MCSNSLSWCDISRSIASVLSCRRRVLQIVYVQLVFEWNLYSEYYNIWSVHSRYFFLVKCLKVVILAFQQATLRKLWGISKRRLKNNSICTFWRCLLETRRSVTIPKTSVDSARYTDIWFDGTAEQLLHIHWTQQWTTSGLIELLKTIVLHTGQHCYSACRTALLLTSIVCWAE